MSIINTVISYMQVLMVSALTLRIVICCIKMTHDEQERESLKKKIKHCIIAAVITIVVPTIRNLIEYYFN